eukprot:6127323-Amphidinium_carterae.1
MTARAEPARSCAFNAGEIPFVPGPEQVWPYERNVLATTSAPAAGTETSGSHVSAHSAPEGILFETKLAGVLKECGLKVEQHIYYIAPGVEHTQYHMAPLSEDERTVLFDATSFVSQAFAEKTENQEGTRQSWNSHSVVLQSHGFKHYDREVSNWFKQRREFARMRYPRPSPPRPSSKKGELLLEIDLLVDGTDYVHAPASLERAPFVGVKVDNNPMLLTEYIERYMKGHRTLVEVTLSKQLEKSKNDQLRRHSALSQAEGCSLVLMYNGSDQLQLIPDVRNVSTVWVSPDIEKFEKALYIEEVELLKRELMSRGIPVPKHAQFEAQHSLPWQCVVLPTVEKECAAVKLT